MAISNHKNLISNMSCLGLHGLSRDAWKRFSESQRKSYDVEKIGYKMNMTDIQASLGNVQLSRINEMRERRKQIWDFYSKNLKETSLELPNLPSMIRVYMQCTYMLLGCQKLSIKMNLFGRLIRNMRLLWDSLPSRSMFFSL